LIQDEKPRSFGRMITVIPAAMKTNLHTMDYFWHLFNLLAAQHYKVSPGMAFQS